MTAGLLVLLAVLALAMVAAEALRRRALARRVRRAKMRQALAALGLSVVTSDRLPEGVDALVLGRPPSLLPAGGVAWEQGDIWADLERARELMRSYRYETLVVRPESLVKITGI